MRHKKSEFSGWHNVDEAGQPDAFYNGDRFLICTHPKWKTVVEKRTVQTIDGTKEEPVEYMEEVQVTLYKEKLDSGWVSAGHEKHNDKWYWVLVQK